MHLAYVDESFNRIQHWAAAVLVEHSTVNETQRALREVVSEAAVAYDISPEAELHGHELYHAKGPFAHLKPRMRIGIYASALRCLEAADCHIILRGVAVPGLRRRYGDAAWHPQRWVVEHLVERIDEFCDPSDHALVVADDHELSRELLADLRRFQERATRGYRARRIRNIVDSIHFVSSNSNPLVQAADLVAFLKRRMSAEEERDRRAARANEMLWSIIEPLVRHDWIWHP